MSSVAGLIVSYVVNVAWEVTLIAYAGWLASRLLKRLGPLTEHVVWVSTLMLAAVAPASSVFRRLLTMLTDSQAPAQHSSMALLPAQSGMANSGGVYALPPSIVWPVLAFFCGSILYFATRLLWSLHGTQSLVQQAAAPSLTPQQEEIWNRCKGLYSLDRVRILASSRISGPVALGMRTPVLLLPAGFAVKCAPDDFLAALAHECAHIKRHDFQKNIFYEAISLIIAFHPVTWALKSQIAQTREVVCDGMATDIIDSRSYTRSLLRLAAMVAVSTHVEAIHAIGIFDANILEKRIMRMNLKKQHVSTLLKYGLMVPATLFLLTVAIGAAARAVTIEPQSPSQKIDRAGSYGHVYKVGKGITAPVLIKTEEAEFPKHGHYSRGFKAIVVVGLIVDDHGMPRDAHIVHSYNKDFDAEAISAVEQYRFKPAMRLGKPVAVTISVEINFKKY